MYYMGVVCFLLSSCCTAVGGNLITLLTALLRNTFFVRCTIMAVSTPRLLFGIVVDLEIPGVSQLEMENTTTAVGVRSS